METLSELIFKTGNMRAEKLGLPVIHVENVKSFIEQLKEELLDEDRELSACDIINKLAGDKLT
jgi:hypothetical protein